jgi:hypothetical protein
MASSRRTRRFWTMLPSPMTTRYLTMRTSAWKWLYRTMAVPPQSTWAYLRFWQWRNLEREILPRIETSGLSWEHAFRSHLGLIK